MLRRSVLITGYAALIIVVFRLLVEWQYRGFDSQPLLMRTGFTVAVIIVVALVGFLHVRFSFQLVRPILKAIEELKTGAYPHLRVEGDDENADLARGFNLMVEELRAREERLRNWIGQTQGEVSKLSLALHEERDRLERALDRLGEGIVILDSDNRVVMVNTRTTEIFGMAPEELCASQLSELLTRLGPRIVDARAIEEVLRRTRGAGEDLDEVSVELDRVGGESVRFYCVPVRGSGGKALGRIATLLDVGKERELERLKTEFLSTVSHELRTPLTSIKGALGLVRGGAAGPVSADMKELLEIAGANVDRLVRLVNDILDISNLERGQAKFTTAPMSVVGCLERATTALAEQAAERRVKIETRIPPELPSAMGDSRRIEQVLFNLVGNAIKFSHQEGRVLIGAAVENGEIVVSISDQGPGIRPEFMSRLFQKFEHSQESLRRDSQGAGLGLAISRHIVEAHGGRIWASSTPGKGSVFFFTLPVAVSSQGSPEPGGSVGERNGRKRILVVDDDPDVTRVISYALESSGYRVIVAHSGGDAIELARRYRPDLVTLDVNMPGMDGYAVVQELRAHEATAAVKILCISVESDLGSTMDRGADFFLQKPIEIHELRAVVDRALGADARRKNA